MKNLYSQYVIKNIVLISKLLISFLVLFNLPNATAYSSNATGAINSLSISPTTGNYDLRVTLTNVPIMCTSSIYNFAYLNTDSENYKSVVANLLMAYSTGKLVVIYTDRDANGFCKISFISVYG